MLTWFTPVRTFAVRTAVNQAGYFHKHLRTIMLRCQKRLGDGRCALEKCEPV